MALENDPEGYRMAQGYAGLAFDKPRLVRHELLCAYSEEWTFDEFQKIITDLSDRIPPEYRGTARVYMSDPGYDGSTNFRIDYIGPESAEIVADRIKRCEEYVAERRAGERRTYEALKAKFG